MPDTNEIPSMHDADIANGEPDALDAVPPTRHSTSDVRFAVDAATGATTVHLVGEFNGWSSDAMPMQRTTRGFEVTVPLPAGSRWRYKLLVDGTRWENDPNASDYAPNEFGGYDSVVEVD